MAKGKGSKSPTWTPFKSNGYAKTVTPKTSDTKAKTHLKQLKSGIKQGKKEQ